MQKDFAQRDAQTTICWDWSLIHQQQPVPSTTLPHPPNTDDEDEMDDNLEHGGVHVDVDTEILNDPLWLEMVGEVTTYSGKRVTDSLLKHRGKKESRLS